jgi:hypothetical protein
MIIRIIPGPLQPAHARVCAIAQHAGVRPMCTLASSTPDSELEYPAWALRVPREYSECSQAQAHTGSPILYAGVRPEFRRAIACIPAATSKESRARFAQAHPRIGSENLYFFRARVVGVNSPM